MRDVIVVGAGGGGPVVAKELAARGLDVLLLEAGAEFKDAPAEWSHFEIDANNPANGYLRFGPADRTKSPWRRDLAQHSAVLQVSGAGGTTLHYFANSPRAMPGVFAGYEGSDAATYDVSHRFPFGYSELVPYYEWVEATLPVSEAPMGRMDEMFLESAQAQGLAYQSSKDIAGPAFRPQQNAILQPKGTAGKTADPKLLHYPIASGCTFCGHCVPGCAMPVSAPRNLRAKRSTHASYIPMALTADLWTSGRAVTLVPDAFAVRVGLDESLSPPVARSVTWRVGATGEFVTEEARVIVLAGGAIESPRLWLNSGLPNPNDQVGRGLTNHYFDIVTGIFPEDTGSSRGPGSGSRADYPGRGSLEPIRLQPALQAFTFATGNPAASGNAHGADSVGRLLGPALKQAMSNVDRLMNVLVMTVDDVDSQNRVLLSSTAPPDEHGPVARVETNVQQLSPRTTGNREFLVAEAVKLLVAAGATAVHRTDSAPVFVHMHSSMRMGLSEADSVLDANGEARAVKGLFVADNSALANALGGPNPTLTTQALATRTAEKIFQLHFGGAPWVTAESPTSSIANAVTKAVLARGL